MVWTQLPYRSLRHARHADAQAQWHDFCLDAFAGRQRYRLRVVPTPTAVAAPLRLRVHSNLGAGQLELDLAALDPGAEPMFAEHFPGDRLGALLCAHSAPLCALEGALGTSLQIDKVLLRSRAARSALTLEITDSVRGRSGRIGLGGDGFLRALQRRQDAADWRWLRHLACRRPLQVGAWICLRAGRLALPRLMQIQAGAVVRVRSEQPLLRLRLAQGHTDFPLTVQDTRCMIQSPPSTPPPADAPLVAVDQLMLEVDVVLANLRLSVEDIARLRPGMTLDLCQPLAHTQVTLRCEGTPFAHGELVRLGERLGVVIERLGAAPAP